MREPTQNPKQWWLDALAGLKPTVTDEPHAGFYKRKLVKGGPYVPVNIWLHSARDDAGDLIEDEKMLCSVDGREGLAADQWLYCCMQPITEKEFDYLSGVSRFAKKHDQREPLANPRKKIDPLKFPLPSFNPRTQRKQKS